METGQHLKHNILKLDSVSDNRLLKALAMCRDYVKFRLRKRTLFGAHNQQRLGMDPIEFYVEYAYDALTNGTWEWKDDRTLGQQLIIIADNQIGKQVEKYRRRKERIYSVNADVLDELFYSDDPPPDEPNSLQELLFEQELQSIETTIKGDENLENFWMCVQEGMKRQEIANFMEKTPKQIDKLREKLINKVKNFL